MRQTSDPGFDIETFVAFLHRQSSEGMGEVLESVLAEPETCLQKLELFIPEVGLMLTRVMFLRDYGAVTAISESLEGPLAEAQIEGASLDHFLAGIPPEEGPRVAYFLGRLLALLVIAKRFLLLDPLERMRSEVMDGSLSQAVLESLHETGPRNQRSIQMALRHRPDGGRRVNRQVLVPVLKRLITNKLIEQKSGGPGAPVLGLSTFGRRLLEEAPPWMEDVEEAYRLHCRLRAGDPSTATHKTLVNLFLRLDRESGRERPDPGIRPNLRRFPHVDLEALPPAEERGLPRIIP